MKINWKSGSLFCVLLAVLSSSTAVALADMEIAPRATASEARPQQRRWAAQGERIDGEQVGERLIDRLLANPKLTAEIGLTEEAVAKLREESRVLQAQQIDLDAQIRKLSLDQADRMSKLLLAADANTNEVMKTVEEIGRLRTEQAKLAVQHLMIIRRHLTPDQIRKARELMRERLKKNGDAAPAEKADARAAKKEKAAAAPAGPLPPKPPEGW